MAAEPPASDDGNELGPTQYGKSEIHLVHIDRATPHHRIRDITVTTTLRGHFADSYVTGDQTGQLPTDSQKNPVFGYARRFGIGALEDFGLRLARHFVADIESNTAARVQIAEDAWQRIYVGGAGHDHSFVRGGAGVRTTSAAVHGTGDAERVAVVAGVRDLVLLKSTASEYQGYLKDPYTTLAEATDRILATSLVAQWRYADAAVTAGSIDWDGAHRAVCATLLSTFASRYSKALQHTLWHMGRAVLAEQPDIAAIHLSAPNKHHFLVDLEPFGLDNPGEVFYAADRPYGMIEAMVQRDGLAERSLDWPELVP
jgi:urate oxidase